MTPEEAIRQAKKGELLPVYVVTGEEQFLRDQVVAEIRASALGGGVPAFNEDRFTAGEVDVDKVLSAARTVPMMAPRRFVLVRGADRWDGGGDESEKKETAASPLDRLAEYLASPVPSTCLVVTAAKLDGRRKFVATAKKKSFLVGCEPLDARALPDWIVARAAAAGHAMDRHVAELLAEVAGPELAYVSDAVERLGLYVGEGAEITEEAVGECVVRVRMADTWTLVDVVRARDLKRGLKLLADVYDPRDHGLPLLGALAWSIRQLTRYVAAVSGGASSDEAAKRAGVHQPFRARELASKARPFLTGRGPRELERWMLVLAETDVALKSSRRAPDAILEDMLTRLCR